MPVREILLLGNERLYDVAEEVNHEELPEIEKIITDMHDTIIAFRNQFGFGRAIAAPQIDVGKRLVCMLTESPMVFINPILTFPDNEKNGDLG
jgi:peptide deformylase